MDDSHDASNPLRELSPIVFVNCDAGGHRTREHLPQIQKLFESSRVDAEFVMTQSVAELESAARVAIAKRHRLLLVMGGDGTFQALVNAAFGADVLLGVVPSGGGNDFAAALGLPDNPLHAAEAILRGSTRLVDLVKVRTADGRARLYAGGGGVGLDAEAAGYASGSYRHLPGRVRYIASALRALAGYTPLDVRIDFPGNDLAPHVGKALLAAALNTPSYGAGLRLAPEAAMDDGLLEIVMLEDLGRIDVLTLLPRLIGSGELRTSRVKRWKAPRVRFTTNRPCLFQGDGEIIGPAPVELEAVPRAIRVLAPSKG
jgi:diacylglycerol kinase (ATP)